MATTTTLFNILDTKFNRMGYNGTFDPDRNRVINHGDEHSTIYQLSSFTDLAYKAVNEELFSGYKLDDLKADRHFKHMFTSRFLLKEIKFQTLDIFRAKLTSMYVSDSQYIERLYSLYDQMVRAVTNSQTVSSGNKNGSSSSRNADSTLPQDNTQLDLNDDVVHYADNTGYRKEKHTDDENSLSNSNSETITPDNLLKLDGKWDELMKKYQKALFLTVWL